MNLHKKNCKVQGFYSDVSKSKIVGGEGKTSTQWAYVHGIPSIWDGFIRTSSSIVDLVDIFCYLDDNLGDWQ